MSETVLLDVTNGVATITLNRPEKLNAMDPPMLDLLAEVCHRVAADRQARCIVVTGAGRAFCAGGDVSAMASASPADLAELASMSYADGVSRLRRQEEASRLLHEMPKPTIAMVNGAAAGAGLSVALACDIRIAGESAKFTTAFAKVGFSGDFGGSYFMTALVGTAKARELYFTSEIIDAHEAARIGLVNRVVPDEVLRTETMRLAESLASGPAVAYALMKGNLNAAMRASLSDMLQLEAERMTTTGQTQDHREAARAFLEKRPPQFSGR